MFFSCKNTDRLHLDAFLNPCMHIHTKQGSKDLQSSLEDKMLFFCTAINVLTVL